MSCVVCQALDPDAGFAPSELQRRSPRCRACEHERNESKPGRRATKSRALRKNTLRRYSLTLEDFDGMVWLQDNACALCKTSFGDKTPCVDHDHDTGEVRGLLCMPCNIGLGHLERLAKLDVPRYLAVGL